MARRLAIAVGLAVALAVPAGALAEDDLTAQDLVYEAADAIDAAVERRRMGEPIVADRLLNEAEDFLVRAERIDPDLGRIRYERARLFHVDGQPDVAETMILDAMQGTTLPIVDHAAAVTLLNSIRTDLGQPTVTQEWLSSTRTRDAGVGLFVGGAIASVVGFSIAFGAISEGAYQQVPIDGARRDVGLITAAIGGGVAIGGGITIVGGQVRVGQLETILPGPWRLE